MYDTGYGTGQRRAGRAKQVFGLGRPKRLGLVLGAVAAAILGLAVVAHGGTTPTYTEVVVQPGDTLWSIATEHYPSDDVRARVDSIEEANGLQSPRIFVGQTLRLPA